MLCYLFKTRLLSNFLRGRNICNRKMSTDRYVWIDLELTGLEPSKDTILEIACIVTTPQLASVHEGINLIIHQSDQVLGSMNDWCKQHHNQSGLVKACQDSKISLQDAENQVVEYVKKHTNSEGTRYLAGNTVYMDRIFISKYMPTLDRLLHYRIIDVSSIKILCSHWFTAEYPSLGKKNVSHRALDDIQASIAELKRYKQNIFKSET